MIQALDGTKRFTALLVATGLVTVLTSGLTMRSAQASPTANNLVKATALSTSKVTLNYGGISPVLTTTTDMGRIAAQTPLKNMHLMLGRSPERQAALDQLIKAQTDPKSPQYHRWLTPQQVGDQYGMSDGDIQQISGWLRANGMNVDHVEESRNQITFSGNAAQVERLFNTEIHQVKYNNSLHYANVTMPTMPAAFADAIVAVRGLHNLHPSSTHKPAGPAQALATPQFKHPCGNGWCVSLVVSDLAIQYNFNDAYAKGLDGSGVTVAIMGQAQVDPSIITRYNQAQLIHNKTPVTNVTVPGEPASLTNDDAFEAYLDTEMVSGLAPSATVIEVSADGNKDGVIGAIVYGINQNIAGIFSVSYGNTEAYFSATTNPYEYLLFSQAAAQGITIITSSGDAGSTAADQDFANPKPATHGLQVSGLTTTPYNISVGGTMLEPFYVDNSTTVNPRGNLSTLKQYVAEKVWNSTCVNYLYAGANVYAFDALIFCNSADGAGWLGTAGGAGGLSSCVFDSRTNLCTGGYPQPSWQNNVVGIQPWNARAIPDVSMMAYDLVICTELRPTCNLLGNPNKDYDFVEGTSASAPIFAAALALVAQSQITPTNPQGRLGLFNPTLYQIAGAQYGTSAGAVNPMLAKCDSNLGTDADPNCVFHDVTTGNNAQPCVVKDWTTLPGAPVQGVCLSSAGYKYGITTLNNAPAYSAVPGYDLASGLGSVNVANLIAAVTALNPLQNVVAKADSNGAAVQLSWTPAAAAAKVTAYNVYMGTTAGVEATTPVMTVTTPNAVIKNLNSGGTYYFTVAAVSPFGVSNISSEVSATALAAPVVVSASKSGGGGSLGWLDLGMGILTLGVSVRNRLKRNALDKVK